MKVASDVAKHDKAKPPKESGHPIVRWLVKVLTK